MTKTISKKRKPYLKLAALVLVGIGVVSIGFPSVIKSFGESAKVIVQGDYIEATSEKASEALGGLVHNIKEIFAGGIDIRGSVSIDPTSGTVDWTDTTSTQALNGISNINVALTQVATTSAANPAEAGYVQNTGATKLCTLPTIYRFRANGLFGSSYAVGTTTWANADNQSLTSTSSATLIASHYVNTSTIGLIGSPSIPGQGGTYFTIGTSANVPSTTLTTLDDLWEWKSGEVFVVSDNMSGATSSDTFNTGISTPQVARVVAQCWNAF